MLSSLIYTLKYLSPLYRVNVKFVKCLKGTVPLIPLAQQNER